MKRFLCIFLSALMVLTVMPLTALADEDAITEISFAPVNGSKVIYEYTNCDHVYNSEGEFDYYWNPPFENGDALTLVYETHSETYYYNNSQEYGWGSWVDSDGNELSADYNVVTQYTFNQSVDNQYTYGEYEYVINVTDPYDGRQYTYRQPFTFAPNPVTGIDVDFGNIVLAEGKDCKIAYDADNVQYNYYNFNYFREGNTVTLHTADGDIVYTCRQGMNSYGYQVMDFFTEDGEPLPTESFVFDDHQTTNHWYGGNTYQVDYTYLGHYTTSFDVTIKPAPISLEVAGFVEPGPYMENSNGYVATDSNGDEYFHYNTKGLCSDGVTLTVGYEDESLNVTYTAESRYNEQYGYTYYVFVDGDGNELQEDIYTVDNQDTEHWGIGENAFHYEVFGLSTPDFYVTITEAPKAMFLEGFVPGSAVEGSQCNVRTDSNNEEYYDYWLPAVCQEGVTLTFTYDNQDDVVYTAELRHNDEYNYDQWVFVDENGEVLSGYIGNDANQSEEHWGVGEHTYNITYGSLSWETTFTVLEAPVEMIIEGMDGGRTKAGEGGYNRTDADGEQYFYYWLPSVYQEGVTVTFRYESGAEDVYHTEQRYNEEDDWYETYLADEDGNEVDIHISTVDDQEENHWGVGEHTYSMTYGNLSQEFTFTIEAAPTAITFAFASEVNTTFNEGMNGYFDEECGHFIYNLPWPQEEGNTITLYYEEGDPVVYTCVREYNEEEDYYEHYFVNEDGDRLDGWLRFEDNQQENPFVVGDNTVELWLDDLSTEVTFTVIEGAVSMDFVTPYPVAIYEKSGGWYAHNDETGEDFYCYDMGFIYDEGNTLTLHFADGDKVYVSQLVEHEDDEGHTWSDIQYININDENDVINSWDIIVYDDQYEAPWGAGIHEISVGYGALGTPFEVEILESDIESVEFVFSRGIPVIQENTFGWVERGENEDGKFEFYFYDYMPFVFRIGNQLIVKYKDERGTVTYTCAFDPEAGEDNAYWFYDEAGNPLDDEPDLYDGQWEEPWAVGEHFVTLSYRGAETDLAFDIIEKAITVVEFTPAEPLVVTEGEGISDRLVYSAGNTIAVTLYNGKSETFYSEIGDEYRYKTSEGLTIWDYFVANNIVLEDDNIHFYGSSEPWEVDENAFLTVEIGGTETTCPVTVIASQVSSISFAPAKPIELMDSLVWWFEMDGRWMSEINDRVFNNGDVLTVNYKDDRGTVKYICNAHGDFVNEKDAEDIIYPSFEYDDSIHYVAGSKVELTIRFETGSAPATATVIACPVESFTYTPAEPFVFTENLDGEIWQRTVYNEKTGRNETIDFFVYNEQDIWAEGSTLTINYNDGRGTVVYTSDGESFISADGDVLDNEQIGALWGRDQWENPYTVGDDNVIYVHYMGIETPVQVTVVPDTWEMYAIGYDNEGNSYETGSKIELEQGDKIFVYFITDDDNMRHGIVPFVGFSDGYDEGTLTQAGYTVTTGTAEELGYQVVHGGDVFGLEIDATDVPVGTHASLNFFLYVLDENFSWDNFDFVNTEHAYDGSIDVGVTGPVVYDYTVTADREAVDFGAKCIDKANPAAQNVVIKNDGDTELTVLFDEYDFFIVNLESGTATLQPGEWATFSIVPKANLAVGNYTDTIAFRTAFGTSANVAVSFTVREHKFGEYVSDGNATYDADGTKTRTCEYCGAKETIADEGSKLIRNGWFDVNGGKSYFVDDVALTGVQRISGKTYVFNDNGIMQTGWKQVDGNWYYLNTDGAAAIGWKQIKNIWYWFDAEGVMATGFKEINGATYYFEGSGAMKTGWFKLTFEDGYYNWYYANSSGALLSGWQKVNNVWYYFVPGEFWMVFGGTAEIGGTTYCFDDNGKMVTGWKQIDGTWYYFQSSGAMVKGWQKISNVWYYFDAEGAMLTGWQEIKKIKYYFQSSGAMSTGWQKIGNAWYYFNASGHMQTGWQTIDGALYLFNEEGVMQTGGWRQIEGAWYYIYSSGAVATGWKQLSGVWYYFSAKGVMATGWQKISGVWYYFQSSGKMQTGWLKDGGKWYYFESSGKMLANTSRKIGSKTYNFNSSGVCLNP